MKLNNNRKLVFWMDNNKQTNVIKPITKEFTKNHMTKIFEWLISDQCYQDLNIDDTDDRYVCVTLFDTTNKKRVQEINNDILIICDKPWLRTTYITTNSGGLADDITCSSDVDLMDYVDHFYKFFEEWIKLSEAEYAIEEAR